MGLPLPPGETLVREGAANPVSYTHLDVYKRQFEHSEVLAKIPSHRLLALFRARKEEFLYLELDPGKDADGGHLYADGRVALHLSLIHI